MKITDALTTTVIDEKPLEEADAKHTMLRSWMAVTIGAEAPSVFKACKFISSKSFTVASEMLPGHWEMVSLASSSSTENVDKIFDTFQSIVCQSLTDLANLEKEEQAHKENAKG